MTQQSLLAWSPPVAAPKADEQTQNLARVEGRLAEAILCWCSIHEHQEFRMSTLTEDVTRSIPAAPDSVRRTLAQLRKQGCVEVELVSRSQSLYRLGQVR